MGACGPLTFFCRAHKKAGSGDSVVLKSEMVVLKFNVRLTSVCDTELFCISEGSLGIEHNG